MPLLEQEDEGETYFFTEERRGIGKDSRGHYVWSIKGVTRSDNVSDGSVLNLTKVRITLGERRDALRPVMREHRRAMRPRMRALREHQRELTSAIDADPFDAWF